MDNDLVLLWYKNQYNRLFDAINEHDPDWLAQYLRGEHNRLDTCENLGIDPERVNSETLEAMGVE